MAGSDRDVRLNVIIDEDGRGARKAADDLDRIDKSAGKADSSLRKLGQGTQRVDADIQKHLHSIKELATEYEKTGNVDVFKNIRKERGALSNLQKIRKELVDMEDAGAKAGSGFMASFGKAGSVIVNGLESAVQSAGKMAASHPWIAAGIAAGITLGTPLIGGALAAAVGAGGIAAGILLAAKDPKVGSAWSALGESAMGKLSGAASVFVEPLIRGAQTFGATLDRIMPNIKNDFAMLAPIADKLFTGAAGFVEKLMPGIDAMSKAAGPVLTDLANELPKLGQAFSQMFKDVSAGGAGGAQALRDMLTVIDITLVSTGKLIWALEKWYLIERSIASGFTGDWDGAVQRMAQVMYGAEQMTPVADKMAGAFKNVSAAIGSTGPAAQFTENQLKNLSGVISQTAVTADTLAGQMTDKLLGSMLSSDMAANNFDKSLITLGDTLVANGGHLTEHVKKLKQTETGAMQNKDAVFAVVEANLRVYDSMIKVGFSAQDAAAKYDENTKALEEQMRQAGMTQGQIDGLIGKYRGVPTNVNTAIATQGLADAVNGLADLIRTINNIPRYTAITVEERHRTTYSNDTPPSQYFRGNRFGGIHYAAQGLLNLSGVAGIFPARSTPTFGFAESGTGGEAFVAKNAPHSRSLQIADEAARWHGGMVVPKGSASGGGSSAPSTLSVIFGGNTDGAFATAFQMLVRTGAIQLQTS